MVNFRHFDDAERQRRRDSRRAVGTVEFDLRILEIGNDGPARDTQDFRNLSIRLAVRGPTQAIDFTRGEKACDRRNILAAAQG